MGRRRKKKTGCFSFIFCYSNIDDSDNDSDAQLSLSDSSPTEDVTNPISLHATSTITVGRVVRTDCSYTEKSIEDEKNITEKLYNPFITRADFRGKENGGVEDLSGSGVDLNLCLSQDGQPTAIRLEDFQNWAVLTRQKPSDKLLPAMQMMIKGPRSLDFNASMVGNAFRQELCFPDFHSMSVNEKRFDIMWSTVFSARQFWMRSPDRWFDNGTSLVSSPNWCGMDDKFVFNVKIIIPDGKQVVNLAFIIDAKTILSSAAFWTFWKLHFQTGKALLVFTENARDDRKGDFTVLAETRSIMVSVNLFVDFVSTFAASFGMASKYEGDVKQEVTSSTNQSDAAVIRKIEDRSEQSLNKKRQNRKMEKHARDNFNKQIQEELKLCRQLQNLKWLLEPGNARVPSPVPLLMEEMLPLWKKYSKVCTKFGFQLNDVLKRDSKQKQRGQHCSKQYLFAGDEQAFQLMDEIYEQAVAKLHTEFTKVTSLCPINMVMNPNKSLCSYGVLKACLKSVKVSVFRSIKGLRFAPFMNSEERRQLYHLMIGGAEVLRGNLVSLYQKRIPNLRTIKDQGISLTQPKIVGHHQWPLGSALIIGDKKMRKTYVKINFKEHLKMVSVDRDGEIQYAVANALKMDAKMAKYLQSKGYHYSFDPKYGYLNSQLTNIGLGMSISIHMIIPHLSKQPFFEDLLRFFRFERKPCGLQYHGDAVTELQSKIQFATDEKEVLESVQAAVLLFAKLDKNMKNGKKFDHLLPAIVRSSWKQGTRASGDFIPLSNGDLGTLLEYYQDKERNMNPVFKSLGCADVIKPTSERGKAMDICPAIDAQ